MKQLITCLLVISLLPLVTHSPSQVSTSLTTSITTSTSTSYSTYTMGVTQLTSTVTNKIYHGNLPLAGWTGAGCGFTAFPFNANPGDQLTVSFNSDVPIDFYLMTIYQFQRVPTPTAVCNYYNALPVFPAIRYLSYQTSYSTSWMPPLPGQYYIVLFNLQNAQALVSISADVIAVQTAVSTIYATTAIATTVQSTRTSTVQVSVNQPATSPSITSQTTMILLSLVLLAVIAAVVMKSKRQAKSEKTRVY